MWISRRKSTNDSSKTDEKWNPMDDFNLLFKMLSITSINFGVFRENVLKKRCMKCVEIIFNIGLAYTMSINFRITIRNVSSPVYSCCAFATIFFLFLIRYGFFRRGNQILSLGHEISEYCRAVSLHAIHKSYRKQIIVSYFICTVSSILMTIIEVNRVIAAEQVELYKKLIASDLSLISLQNEFIQTTIVVFEIGFEILAFMTYLSTVLFCCTCYVFLHKLFEDFCSELRLFQKIFSTNMYDTEHQKRPLRKIANQHSLFFGVRRVISIQDSNIKDMNRKISNFVMEKIDQFNNLKHLASKTDDMLSPFAISLLSLAVSSLFETQSFTILAKGSFTNQKLNFLFEVLMTLLSFFVVTSLAFCGSKVSKSAENISQNVREFASKICPNTHSLNSELLILALIFVNNCNKTEIHMTGWKMFNINKSLILSVVGGLITYGVIINQMIEK